jgi:hypothetical protein
MDRFTLGYNGDRHKGKRIGTLWTNQDIDGDVTLTDFFDEQYDVAKIDILNDCIALLNRELELLLKDYSNPMRRMMGWPIVKTDNWSNQDEEHLLEEVKELVQKMDHRLAEKRL